MNIAGVEVSGKRLQAVIDYINENAPKLHGVLAKDLDIGEKILTENVVKMLENAQEVIVLVDRGVKGLPKYTIPLTELGEAVSKSTAKQVASVEDEVEARKVDATQARLRGRQ